jgi:hypothetical protein
VLAARVGGSSTAVIVTASVPLGTGQDVRLGPLGEQDLGAVVGESRPEVCRALWLAPGGLPGPAVSLAGRLGGLDPGADPVVRLAQLRSATGRAGRSRGISPEAERARVNVTRTLRATLARITEMAPAAGAHLQASIRTGGACRYQPAAGGPAGWDL